MINDVKIVLDIQSSIHAHNMERMLMQELDDFQIVISESPASAAWVVQNAYVAAPIFCVFSM